MRAQTRPTTHLARRRLRGLKIYVILHDEREIGGLDVVAVGVIGIVARILD